MNRLRILSIAPTPWFSDRGCHIRILEEARALQLRGHKVIIVTYHIDRDIPGTSAIRIRRIPWYRKLEAGFSISRAYLDWLVLGRALRLAKRFKPHIIHGHLYTGALIAKIVGFRYGVPVVFDFQSSMTSELIEARTIGRGSFLERFLRGLERFLLRLPDHIVTSSTRSAGLLQGLWVKHSRVTPLPDGVGLTHFDLSRPSSSLRAELGIPYDAPLGIYAGTLNEIEGISSMLGIISRVLSQRDCWFLIIGYPEEHYVKMSKLLGIDKRVIFLGRIPYEEVPRYLKISNFALTTKQSETEANAKLFCYMSASLPVVAYENDVNREALGEYGCYARDEDEFVNRIIGLIDSPSDAGPLLRRRLEENFTWEKLISRLEDVYDKILR